MAEGSYPVSRGAEYEEKCEYLLGLVGEGRINEAEWWCSTQEGRASERGRKQDGRGAAAVELGFAFSPRAVFILQVAPRAGRDIRL